MGWFGPGGANLTGQRSLPRLRRLDRRPQPSAGSSPWAARIALGPRLGVASSSETAAARCRPTISPIGAIGGVILWFGWYGFNPGSTLSAMDWQGIGRISANTTLAACCGPACRRCCSYSPKTKKWDLGISVNGFLGGLVAITCPCYWVSPWGAIVIGAVAGVVVCLGIDLLEYLRIDDPIGAWPVHGLAGIWGTLSLGLLATGQYGVPTADGFDTSTVVRGLFYGGGGEQLFAQIIGSMTCVVCVLGVTLLINVLHQGDPGKLDPSHLPGRRARGDGHPRARHARLPRRVRPGHDVFLAAEPAQKRWRSDGSGCRQGRRA